MHKKAQFAMEYTLVIALLFTLLIPGIYLYYQYSQSTLAEISTAKIADIGNSIINNAENSYYLGKGSRVTLDVSMPVGVTYNPDPAANPNQGSRIKCSTITDYCELVFDLNGNEIIFSTDVDVIRWVDDGSGQPKKPTGLEEADNYFLEEQISGGRKQVIIQTYDNFVTIDIK